LKGGGVVMADLQKVFLLGAVIYLVCKGIIFFLLYVATLRVERKGLEYKKRREQLLRIRRMRNMELYGDQYEAVGDKRKARKANAIP